MLRLILSGCRRLTLGSIENSSIPSSRLKVTRDVIMPGQGQGPCRARKRMPLMDVPSSGRVIGKLTYTRRSGRN